MSKLIDLTGQKFGRLTVIERAENSQKHTAWLCECDCGQKRVVQSDHLKSGHTKSCGCYKADNLNWKTHEKSNTRLYEIMHTAKSRCYREKDKDFKLYGGRGITVCDEWLNDFQAFYDWAMQNGYADNLTLDRIDNDKGYSPDNCRWVNIKTQQNNRRNNHYITYNGKTQTLQQWANELNLNRETILSRLNRGWSVKKALTEPLHK